MRREMYAVYNEIDSGIAGTHSTGSHENFKYYMYMYTYQGPVVLQASIIF